MAQIHAPRTSRPRARGVKVAPGPPSERIDQPSWSDPAWILVPRSGQTADVSVVYWLIRAGEDSRHAREFALNGVVALGWARVPGLGDLDELSREQIAGLIEVSAVTKTPSADANELVAFRDELQRGHVVITPDSTTRELLVGEVTGPYEFLDPSPAGDYRHVRTVRWLRRWPRQEVPEALLQELRYRRTLRRLTHQDEWAAIVARLRDGAGRPPEAVGPVGQARARPTAATRPVEPPSKVCVSCGLRRATSQFTAGSDICNDCS
jgi:hypothetical protein